MNAKSKRPLLVFALLSLTSSLVCAKQSENKDDLGDLLVEKGLVSQDQLNSLRDKAVAAERSKSVRLRGDARIQYVGSMPTEPDLPKEDTDAQNKFKFRVQAFALRSVWDLGSGFSAHFDMGMGGDEARAGFAGVRGVRVLTAFGRYEYNDLLTLDAGFKGVPFGYEEGLSSNEIKTFGRTPANSFFDTTLALGNRYTGLFAHGNITEGLYYRAAVTNSLVDDLKGSTRAAADKITSSRNPALWAQLGYKNTSDAFAYDFGASVAWLPNQVLSTDNPAFDAYQFGWNLFARVQWERLDVLADFYASHVQHAMDTGYRSVGLVPFGFSIIPAYKITDSIELVGAVSYINAHGVPASRFSRNPNLTATVPLISPSTVLDSADSGDTYFNQMVAWYGGVNYYLNDNVKLTAGYQYAQFKGRDLGQIFTDNSKRRHHGVGAQLQLVF